MAVTIDNQTGNWCHVQDTLANIVTALAENNVIDAKNVAAVFHDGTNYHCIFKRQ